MAEILEIDWEPAAINLAAGFLSQDPDGVADVMSAVDQLIDDPRPTTSTAHGSEDQRRLHVGRYRVWYRIDGTALRATHLGAV